MSAPAPISRAANAQPAARKPGGLHVNGVAIALQLRAWTGHTPLVVLRGPFGRRQVHDGSYPEFEGCDGVCPSQPTRSMIRLAICGTDRPSFTIAKSSKAARSRRSANRIESWRCPSRSDPTCRARIRVSTVADVACSRHTEKTELGMQAGMPRKYSPDRNVVARTR